MRRLRTSPHQTPRTHDVPASRPLQVTPHHLEATRNRHSISPSNPHQLHSQPDPNPQIQDAQPPPDLTAPKSKLENYPRVTLPSPLSLPNLHVTLPILPKEHSENHFGERSSHKTAAKAAQDHGDYEARKEHSHSGGNTSGGKGIEYVTGKSGRSRGEVVH